MAKPVILTVDDDPEVLQAVARDLRQCLLCGHIGCCDSSKNKHATNHPIVKSFEPGEEWRWCYIDKTFV